jgi:hypothetical protein
MLFSRIQTGAFPQSSQLLFIIYFFLFLIIYAIMRTNCQIKGEGAASKPEYKPGVLDDLFLSLFRNKLVKVGFS